MPIKVANKYQVNFIFSVFFDEMPTHAYISSANKALNKRNHSMERFPVFTISVLTKGMAQDLISPTPLHPSLGNALLKYLPKSDV